MADWRAQLEQVLERVRVLAVPVVAGFVLILYAAVGLLYVQERQAGRDMREQIQVLDRLLRLTANRVPLEDIQARGKAVDALIPADILPDQDVFPIIRILAAEGGVQIQDQKSRQSRPAKLGQADYSAYLYSLSARGGYIELMNFVATLEYQERLPTLIVRKVSIDSRGDASTVAIDYEVLAKPQKAG